MKLSAIYNDLISESKQVGTVYHFTSISSIFYILQSNKLKGFDSSRLDTFTVSTTRNKNFWKERFARGEKRKPFNGNHIGLVLDGTKISNTYQTKAHHDAVSATEQELWGDESEQIWYGRQLSRDGGIDNIRKYLLGVILIRETLTKQLSDYIYHSRYIDNEYLDYLYKLYPYDKSAMDPSDNPSAYEKLSDDEKLDVLKDYLINTYHVDVTIQ